MKKEKKQNESLNSMNKSVIENEIKNLENNFQKIKNENKNYFEIE